MLKQLFIKVLTAVIVLLTTVSSFAQSGWRVGFGVSPGVATKDPFKYTLGGDVKLQKSLGSHAAATLSAGFTHFFEKDHFAGYNQYGSPYNVIPVKAGAKVFLSDNLYVAGEAGVGFGFEQWGQSFVWSPSAGLSFNNGLDLSIRYEDFTRSNITKDVSLRLTYGISAKKMAFHKKSDTEGRWYAAINEAQGIATNDGFVLGGEAAIYKAVASNIELYASAGVTHYFNSYQNYYIFNSTGVSFTSGRSSTTLVPVKVGVRLYAGNKFYFSGDAGAAFGPDGKTAFTYSPTIGLGFKNGLDLAAKYDGYTGYYYPGVIALKFGYRFKL